MCMIVQNSNSQVWGSGMYSIFHNLNLVINRRVTKTVLYSKNAPSLPGRGKWNTLGVRNNTGDRVKFLRSHIYFLALFMGDNIFHVILERTICYENPPTDKRWGGGGTSFKKNTKGSLCWKDMSEDADAMINFLYYETCALCFYNSHVISRSIA